MPWDLRSTAGSGVISKDVPPCGTMCPRCLDKQAMLMSSESSTAFQVVNVTNIGTCIHI